MNIFLVSSPFYLLMKIIVKDVTVLHVLPFSCLEIIRLANVFGAKIPLSSIAFAFKH